jgi:hypothetical protein
MKMVLIDTCAWIDFFKSRTGELGNKVASLIELNQAAITGFAEFDSLFANRRQRLDESGKSCCTT